MITAIFLHWFIGLCFLLGLPEAVHNLKDQAFMNRNGGIGIPKRHRLAFALSVFLIPIVFLPLFLLATIIFGLKSLRKTWS